MLHLRRTADGFPTFTEDYSNCQTGDSQPG
jgi:hypothetical protein